MNENSLHSEDTDSVSCFCLLLYTFLIAVVSFWIGTLFRTYWSSTGALIGFENLPQLRSHLAFVSLSEFIRRRIKYTENKIRNEVISSLTHEDSPDSPNRIEIQRNILVDSIVDCYVFPWYNRISGEDTFPQQFKQVLQTVFNRLRERIQKLDRTNVAKEIIQLLHSHWKEYCSAVDKQANTSEPIVKIFKFNHEYVINPAELSKHYEYLVHILLKDVLIQELNCNMFRQFLSGILVKCFVMYYTNIASEPRWVNKILIALISTGSFSYDGEPTSCTQPSSPTMDSSVHESRETLSEMSSSKTNKFELLSDDTNNGSPPNQTPALELKTSQEYLPDSFKNIKMKTPDRIPTPKESITNFFITDSPGYKKMEYTPRATTISAALGEILSSAALPLLPEGCAYKVPEENETLLSEEMLDSTAGELIPPENSSKEVRFSYKNLEEPGENGAEYDSTAITRVDSTGHTSTKSRHFSLLDYGKSKSSNPCKDKPCSTSLDETKASQTLARQNEFEWKPTCEANLTEEEQETTRLNKESEDFAATIAKLRSLLEQRESQNNLMEFMEDAGSGKTSHSSESESGQNPEEASESNNSPKIPVCKMKSSPQMGTTPNLGSDMPDTWGGSLETDKIVDELEESEAEVNCFFLNVLITKTEPCSELGAQSTLYCIQYEGVYLEYEKDGQAQKFVLRTTTVKRKFKDFVLLQNQLEGNPIWKPHLRGMKTPKKWLHISFTNQNAVNQRRAHLEHYLQQLCYHPTLGFCKELRQFMAYGEDGYQAFGVPPSDLARSHKFEKLAKTFTEVFNTLRDAVPHFEPDFPTSAHVSDSTTKRKKIMPSFLNFEKSASDDFKVPDISICTSSDDIVVPLKMEQDAERKDDGSSSDLDPENGLEMNENSSVFPLSSLPSEFSNKTDDEAVEAADSIYPLASSVTQFLCDVLWLPQHKPHSASVLAFMAISGKSLENYLQESLDLFLCEEAFVGYLDMLTASLNEWSQQSESNTPRVDYEPEFSQFDLKNSFKQKIPVWIRWMWGRNRSEETIDRLVGFFQHVDLNNDLILSIAELIFLKLIDSNEPQ